jgi:hypothetical protein
MVMQVRADGDRRAARVDRAISSMRASESSTMVLCKSSFRLLTSTTVPLFNTWTYSQIALTDDFISLSQQFNEFKVKFMKFEIFHTNPTASANVAISTLHGDFDGGIPSSYTSEANVIDAPDGKYLSPGSEPLVLYWNATGTPENDYQNVASFSDYGGFRSALDQTTSVQLVGTVIATACVVFRGRH